MARVSSPVEVVVAALAPFLGRNMARAAVNGQQLKLGLSPTLEGGDLDKLLDALMPGLGVFVGRDKTREVADEIACRPRRGHDLSAATPTRRKPERKPSRAMLPFAAAATFFYVSRALWPDGPFATLVSAKRAEWIGCLLKFLCLVLGARHGLRAARYLEADNPSRRAWRWLGLGLGAFAAGQAVLSFYQLALGRSPPLPSIGDPPFLIGYALMIAATIDFVRVYVASGFPVGSPRSRATLAGAAAVAFIALGVPLLRPIASASAPLAERAINVAYPLLDFVALVPALVLVRVTIAFRGGGVWRVWAALLLGWIFMAAGDVLFAYLSTAELPKLVPFVDLTLLLGYLFAALGTMLEVELLEAPIAAARAAAAYASDRIA